MYSKGRRILHTHIMPKTRAQKEQIVEKIADQLTHMKAAAFITTSGYTMTDADSLRAQGRELGVELTLAKKTLLLLALQKSNLAVSKEQLEEGSVLAVMGLDDEVSAAKMMAKFLKDRESMKFIGGILEGKFVDAAAVQQLSKLPGKHELLAQLVRTFNAPVTGFVCVLSGNLRGLITVLNAIKEAKA